MIYLEKEIQKNVTSIITYFARYILPFFINLRW